MAERPAGTTRPFGVAGRVGVTLAATLLLTIIVTAVGGAMSGETTTTTTSSTTPTSTNSSTPATTTIPPKAALVRDRLDECGGQHHSVLIAEEADRGNARFKVAVIRDTTCPIQFCVEGNLESVVGKSVTLHKSADGYKVLGEGVRPVTIEHAALTLCPDQLLWHETTTTTTTTVKPSTKNSEGTTPSPTSEKPSTKNSEGTTPSPTSEKSSTKNSEGTTPSPTSETSPG